MSKQTIFTESPAQRIKRLINEEKEKLRKAERKLLNGSLVFTLQEVHQGKATILEIKGKIRTLEAQLEREAAK